MPAIPYKSLPQYLKNTPKGELPAVFLIYGEEYLYKEALGLVLEVFYPDGDQRARAAGYEPLDGISANIAGAIERLNTYSLLGNQTVVSLTDARIFDSKQDSERLIISAKKAFENDDIKKAGRYLPARQTGLFLYAILNIAAISWKVKNPVVKYRGVQQLNRGFSLRKAGLSFL